MQFEGAVVKVEAETRPDRIMQAGEGCEEHNRESFSGDFERFCNVLRHPCADSFQQAQRKYLVTGLATDSWREKEHVDMTIDVFKPSVDDNGVSYLVFDLTLSGTNTWQGSWNAKEPPRPVFIYPNSARPDLCFVKLYYDDIAYRRQNNITCDRWYLQPQAIKMTKPQQYTIKFTNGPMGINSLRKLLPELSKRAGVTEKYTGRNMHTAVNCAIQAGISASEYVTLTGRKRLQSLDPCIHDATTSHAKAVRFQDSVSVRSQPQAVINYNSNASSSQDSTSAKSQSLAMISYSSNAFSSQTGAPGQLALHQSASAAQPEFHAVEEVECINPRFSHCQPNNAMYRVQQPHFAVAPTVHVPVQVHVPGVWCQGQSQASINQDMLAAFSLYSQALNSGFSSIIQHFRGNPRQ